MPIDPKAASSYLQYLPAIFSEDPFLGRFLLAFEQILTGLPGVAGHEPEPAIGMEEIVAAISALFDPGAYLRKAKKKPETGFPEEQYSPEEQFLLRDEFLPWMANWVALGLRADWTTAQKADFLANIV